MVEKANMDNILVDYADDIEQETHFRTLCNAIKQATGKDISLNNFFLLSKDFIESFGTQSKDNVYTETDYTEDSESEEIIYTTEHYNYNNSYEPLINEEIQSLIDDLRNKQSNIRSGNKSLLKHLEISLDRSSNNIRVGTNDKKVHPLLSRLYKTKKDLFYITKRGGC